jgi:hypothetical protein
MSDRVAMMKQERSSVSVHFQTFIRKASDRSLTICLLEGEDAKYLGIRLDITSTPFPWHAIDCSGKKNVLALYKIITNHQIYKNSLIAGFVDLDFDEPLENEFKADKIYETPCYSIENLYCTNECLSKVFSAEFKFNNNIENINLIDQVLDNFRMMQNKFHQVMRPVNVWVKAHRKKECSEGFKSLNLHNVNLDKIVKIENGGVVVSKVSTESIPSLFSDCYQLSQNELEASELELPTTDCHMHFRGKYELEFVRQYLSSIKVECDKPTSEFYNPKCAVKLSLSKGNFISELSQYASTPDCLKAFIKGLSDRYIALNISG